MENIEKIYDDIDVPDSWEYNPDTTARSPSWFYNGFKIWITDANPVLRTWFELPPGVRSFNRKFGGPRKVITPDRFVIQLAHPHKLGFTSKMSDNEVMAFLGLKADRHNLRAWKFPAEYSDSRNYFLKCLMANEHLAYSHSINILGEYARVLRMAHLLTGSNLTSRWVDEYLPLSKAKVSEEFTTDSFEDLTNFLSSFDQTFVAVHPIDNSNKGDL